MKKVKIQNLIARTFISAIFIYAIPGKIIHFEKTLELITSKNIPSSIAPFLLISAILCLFFGSILFISGFKQKIGSLLLITFIVPTTFIFHFSPFQIKAFLMNTGLVGGLILGMNIIKSDSLIDIFHKQTKKK